MDKIVLERIRELNYDTTEAMRSLRTNISFCGDDIQSILITSSEADEGKSETAMNLARAMAETGKKVVLVDTDLRKSVLVGKYGIHREDNEKIYGLSHYLAGQKNLDQVLYSTSIENLDLVVAGPSAPNPTELLNNHYFDEMMTTLRNSYDIILMDGSPLGLVIDSAIIATKCDGAIMVIEQGRVSRKFAFHVKKQLEKSGTRILGAVLNKVKRNSTGYYKKYYKGHYTYYSNQVS
jgi:capsular exopolysaccharide synthesis family protein